MFKGLFRLFAKRLPKAKQSEALPQPNVVVQKADTPLEKLAQRVSQKYASDHCRAKVTVSQLEDGRWYCTITRYPDGKNSSKIHVVEARSQRFEDCLRLLEQKWVA